MRSKKGRKAAFIVKEVPHRQQRYETVGDWIPGNTVEIRVSSMKDKRYVFLVALHEMIEYELCAMKGVTDAEVVDFDKGFEAERKAGLHAPDEEPGDDIRAPYNEEHSFATIMERTMAQKLGVRWSDYEKVVSAHGRRTKVPVRQLLGSGGPVLPRRVSS